jgi:uncharacterized membrane protein YoaK (UPF0700 family)
LTVVTGIVDAVSYLRLDHVFVANMTGNVVFLGFAAAGAAQLSATASLIAIAFFLAGSVAGGRLAAGAVHRGRLLAFATFGKVLFVGAAAIVAAFAEPALDQPQRSIITALLAFAMGLQNATVRRIGVPDATTTVLTMTLTGLGADSSIAGGKNVRFGRRLTAVLAMLAGAFAGAAIVLRTPHPVSGALALATLILAMTSALAYNRARGDEPWAKFSAP